MRAIRRHHARRVKNRLLRRHFHRSRDSVNVPYTRLLKIAPNWVLNSPRWWRKSRYIQPSRAGANRLLNQVMRGVDADCIRRWPDYRKPHIYYW